MTFLIKPELEAEVERLGDIYKVCASFDRSLESLREFQIMNPISIKDLAYARVKEGKNSHLSRYGSYTKEGFLSLRNEPVLLALNSPLLDLELARQAVKTNKNGDFFKTNKIVYYKYRKKAENEKNKDLEERSVLILPKRENFSVLTKEFNESKFSKFLFKDQAENYGKFLKKNRISEMPLWLLDKNYVDNKEESILTQLWFDDLGNKSVIYGRNLGYINNIVLGVKESKSPNSKFKKIAGFFQKLRQ